jgi:[protein-PII] uridylyltransferase
LEVRRRRPGAQGVHGRHGHGQNLTTPGIAAARTRSDHVESLIAGLAPKLEAAPEPLAVVALGAYGRRELTPRSEIELLLLSARTNLPTRWVTEVISYPLWEQHLPVEPLVRTLAESAADARRSWSAAARFLDARLVTGDRSVFEDFERQISQPWRRDRERLVHRVRADVQRRHASHASATMSPTPDLIAGRGGLNDLQALRWLTSHGASQRPPNQLPPHAAGSSTQKALATATRTLQP